jgi:hypothetical protein
MIDTEWKLLQPSTLFSDRDTTQEAMQYIDEILMRVPAKGGDRMIAYTAVYLLYNTVVKHYNKQIEEHNEECYQ